MDVSLAKERAFRFVEHICNECCGRIGDCGQAKAEPQQLIAVPLQCAHELREVKSPLELWLVFADTVNDQRAIASDALNRLLSFVHRKLAGATRCEFLAKSRIRR